MVFNNYKSVKNKYNLNKFPEQKQRFYYRFDHDSSLGYEYIAKVYFNALIGKKNFSVNRIKCFFSENNHSLKKELKVDLSSIKSISIMERTHLLSLLSKNIDYQTKDTSYNGMKQFNTTHFISFSNKIDFLKSPFFFNNNFFKGLKKTLS